MSFKIILRQLGKVYVLLILGFALGMYSARSEESKGFTYDRETDQYYANPKTSFSIRPIEDARYLERIEVSVDHGAFKTYEGKLKFDKEGAHLIRFRARDPVLNWSPIQSFRVVVDPNSPVTEASWKGRHHKKGEVLYVHPSTSLVLNGKDHLSGIGKRLWKRGTQKAPSSYRTPLYFKKEGSYKIQYASVDRVGNQEAWKNLSFKVDRKPPRSTPSLSGSSYQKKDRVYMGAGTQLRFEAKDDGSGLDRIEYKVNSGKVKTYQSAIALVKSKTIVKYRAVDNVGNSESWKNLTIYQDSKAPALRLTKKGKWVERAGKIYARPGFRVLASVKEAQSGIQKVEVAFDGKTFQKSKERTFRFDQEKTYQFNLRAKDQVGNLGESNPLEIVVDSKPPSSTLTSSQPLIEKEGIFLSSLPNRIEIDASDDESGVSYTEISYDGKRFKKFKGSLQLSQFKKPTQTLYFRSVDRLGNRESVQKKVIHIRTRGPRVDLFVESGSHPKVPLSGLKRKKTRGVANERNR